MGKRGGSKEPVFQAVLALAYVGAVLALDAFGIPERVFPRGRLYFHGADLFKLTAWFVIPFLFCLPRLNWAYFNFRRWRRIDYYLLGGLILAGLIAVVAIPVIPVLRDMVPRGGGFSLKSDMAQFRQSMMWTFSWLLGWEFMHRYLLLRRLAESWPRFGWLLIPVFEGAYHLTWWPAVAMPLGMVVFSLVVTPWALRRRNTLLPFLAHLAIEIEFSAFVIFAG